MKKILLFFSILLFPFFVNASSMYQDIEILPNGDLKIKESIAIDGSYNGFKLTLGYKYFDENRIYSADSLEVIKVCESNKNNPLEDIGTCFDKVEYASKGDSLKYTHEVDSNVDTFMFYNPSRRNKAFYIEYILKNVIVGHNDINELRLNMLDSSFNESLDKIEIKVHLPEKAVDLRAWAHGPLWGNIKLDENKEYVLFTIDDYDAYTAIDIRMTFDKSLVTTEKKTNIDKLSSIINEETILADKANKDREEAIKLEEERQEYLEQQQKEWEELVKKKNKSLILLSSVWLIIAIIVVIDYYKKHDKEYDSNFTNKYFRDFPSNHSPEVIEYLMNKKVSTIGLTASILNIIYKKGFIVEKKMIEKGLLKKKMVEEYELTLNDENLKESLTENEKSLRDWLISSFGTNNKFLLSSLKDTDNSESEAREFLREYNSWKNDALKEARKEMFYEDKSSKKVWLILFGCIPFILTFMYIEYNPLVIILAILAIIFIIYIASSTKRTRNGNELYLKWNGLKNFIKDFGNFEEKELPDIKLWEKYLVYAHIFGLADELRKQMEVKIPNVDEVSSGLNTYDYIRINNAISKSVTTTVNAAITNANSKIASSESSSGGGFGGGFSGGSSGGGFSGGGGSGGGRF